jgi:hypothetical protein
MSTPVATAGAGTMMDSWTSNLSGALGLWGQIEQIKSAKSASGGDQQQALMQPELPNGAAVSIDASLAPKLKKSSIEVNKPLLFASAGLLAIAFLLNRMGK